MKSKTINPRVKAAQEGRSRYQGNPCKICGEAERFTANGNCANCQRGHNRAYQVRLQQLLAAAKAGGRIEILYVRDDQ